MKLSNILTHRPATLVAAEQQHDGRNVDDAKFEQALAV